MKRKILNPAAMLAAGLILGTVSRLLDIFTQNLGNIFSQMAIWILIGTVIAIYSDTPKRAMANVFPLCAGMLATYYATAAITHGVYHWSFIVGWSVFALCAPLLAYCTWMTKERGWAPKLLAAGIVAVSVLSSVVLFDRLRWYDYAIDAALVYFLFFAKVERGQK